MKAPVNFRNIQEIRDSVDKIDYRILQLFRDRDQCTEQVINFKTDREGVIAKKRQHEILTSRRKWAEELRLDPDLFEKIFRMLINSNIKKQLEILKQQK